MNYKPIKVEYYLEIMKHSMKASANHHGDKREVKFFFDDKLVSTKVVPEGDLLSDDDCISEIVENYCKNNVGVYADIFKRHSDKVSLVAKTVEVALDLYGIEVFVHVTVEKERYIVELTANNGDDRFVGTFKSVNFSEVLEKVRLFTSSLEGISVNLTEHISEISSDKIEEWIKWQ